MSSIFISHSSRDNALANELKAWLEARGHRSVFLDFDPADGIPAGRDWEKEVYRGVRTCRAVLALCSAYWLASRWCFVELTYARALGKQVFPIRVDDSPLTELLSDTQAIDMRTDREDALARLWKGLLDAGIDPADAFDWDHTRPAYPGLLAFQEEDAAVFFGRDDERGKGLDLLNICHRLGDTNLVLAIGASGSGKSSLVRAGLLPYLRRDTTRWLVLDPFRPRGDPAGELAAVLARAFDRAGAPRTAEAIGQTITEGGLGELLRSLRRTASHADARMLLTIDQFEELLGQPFEHPSSRFVRLLGECLRPGTDLMVLATMRSDFLELFQKAKPFVGLRFESLSLGPMMPDAIEQVITRPAALAGIDLGPGLVQRLVDDARSQDALPLLAFTLRELAERYGADGRIDLDEYKKGLGGMQAALAKSAEELIARDSLTDQTGDDLRRAFLGLVRVTEQGTYARKMASWADIPPSVRGLLNTFVSARLLVSRGDGQDAVLEVAHEAIFKSWTRLAEWLKDSAASLQLREQIVTAAKSWNEAGQHDDDLWRGGRLSRAKELLNKGDVPIDDPVAIVFVDKSITAEGARVAEDQQRQRTRLRLLTTVAVGGLVLSLGLVASQCGLAQNARELEEKNDRLRQTNRELELSGRAQQAVELLAGPSSETQSLQFGRLLSVHAFTELEPTPRAALGRRALFEALNQSRDGRVDRPLDRPTRSQITSAAFVGESGRLYVVDARGEVETWAYDRVADRFTPERVVDWSGRVSALAVRPGDRQLAVGHQDGSVTIRELPSESPAVRLEALGGRVVRLEFSDDGAVLGAVSRSLAPASETNTPLETPHMWWTRNWARVVDVERFVAMQLPRVSWQAFGDDFGVFSSKSSYLLWFGLDIESQTLRMLDPTEHKLVRSSTEVSAVVADHKHAASIGKDGTIYDWKIVRDGNNKPISAQQILPGKNVSGGPFNLAALSPDGEWILLGASAGDVVLLHGPTATMVGQLLKHSGAITFVGFDSESKWAIVGDGAGMVRLFPVDTKYWVREVCAAIRRSDDRRVLTSPLRDALYDVWNDRMGGAERPCPIL